METKRATSTAAIEVPPGFKLHTENTSHILLPENNEAFLNPVQEFNRDLSVACIRTWAAERAKLQESKWLQHQEKERAGNGQSKKRIKGPQCLWSLLWLSHPDFQWATEAKKPKCHRWIMPQRALRSLLNQNRSVNLLRDGLYLIWVNSSSQRKLQSLRRSPRQACAP